MDPNPKKFPIVSYVISRLPHPGLKAAFDSGPTSSLHADLEQPPSPRHTGVSPTASSPGTHLVAEMPHLNDPEVMSSMALAVSEVAQTRSILQTLGDRPDHETVDGAKAKISEIDARLATQQEEIVLSPRSPDVDRLQWRAHLADKEDECRRATEEERRMYKAVIQLDEMHEAYQKLLKDAEDRLSKIYDSAASGGVEEDSTGIPPVKEEVNEEVVGILQEATGKGIERVDLSGRQLRILPEAFGLLRDLVVFNLSSNQLKSIPDSIAGLQNLEELHLSSNLLESLPDSIGLLHNLRIVNASGNKLSALPDSICHCRSLVELDVSFNCLTFLPTNIGHELGNLRRLSVQLNKIRSLPTSIGEMRSLRILDAHFNELHGMPITIGRLTSLEVLNLSSNFSDMTELPDTIGELTNLQELDLSNNQIHALPDAFGRLDSLVKLNLDQNPLVVPPKEAVDEGVEAVKAFMAKRLLDVLLVEEERCSMMERKEQVQTGWLSRSTSWLSDVASGVSESVTGYLGSPRKAPRDPYLDQSL